MIACLPTKFHRPALPANLVARLNLVTQLNEGLVRGHKLSLVVAPAGFGKTTLVNAWLDALPLTTTAVDRSIDLGLGQTSEIQDPKCVNLQCAWLSLDEMDNDLERFFKYVVAAVQNVFPGSGIASLQSLQAPQLPPVGYLARTLLQEWTALPGECLLILEDYQAITETAIHQLIAQLLEHLPRQIHLVLISRTEPPLPSARLRVRQQMTEIRAAELCFSQAETQTFLTQALGRAPASETVTALQDQTEGWVAGLQLAALALTGAMRSTHFAQENELNFARTFAQNNRHVMAYLVEEVLAQQPLPVQTFLLHTALLDRFCASLAEALLADEAEGQSRDHGEQILDLRSNSLDATWPTTQAILAHLVQTNLFIVPLDAEDEWYRYHHLFRDLLRHRLRVHKSPTQVAMLHRRASAWLASHGWIEEAIQQALAGGDELAAAHLVASHRHELLDREDWRTLDHWLSLLPETLVQQHPALLICKAWLFSLQFKLEAIPPFLQAVVARLEDPRLTKAEIELLHAEIDIQRSKVLYWQNEGQYSLAAAQQALTRISTSYLYAYSSALFYLGLAAQMTGQSTVELETLRATLKTEQASSNALVTRTIFALTFIHYFAGELTIAQQSAEILLQVATQANLALSIGWAHYLLGCIAYEWNELETAAQHFIELVEQRYSSHILTVHNSWLRLAWIEQLQGRPDQAQQQVAELLQFHHKHNHLNFLPLVHSFQARLALQQVDIATAARWVQVSPLVAQQGPLIHFELPALTYAKLLLAQGTPASLTQALVNLAQLCEVAEFTHNTLRLIETLAVQALVEAAQGQTELALATLHRAVELAKPGRCIRTFVDLGPALAGLLYELTKRNCETEYLGQVLGAFPPSMATADPAQQVRRTAQTVLIEPLTERESEVLLYLQLSLPNKLIARKLNISALTVKKHTISLYQKLGVQSRQQAVSRAKALGILSTEQA